MKKHIHTIKHIAKRAGHHVRRHVQKHGPKMPVAIIVIAAALVGYWVIAPRLFPKHTDMTIPPEMMDKPAIVGIARFTGSGGRAAQGTAMMYKVGEQYSIRLESDFKVSEGSDLALYLGGKSSYEVSEEIALLKSTTGTQDYTVPAAINAEKYNTIWIASKKSSAVFGKAILSGGR